MRMRRSVAGGMIAAFSGLAACTGAAPEQNAQLPLDNGAVETIDTPPASSAPYAWELVASGEGTGLRLSDGTRAALHLFCPAGGGRLIVNVPGFRAVRSEERLSFGGGGAVVALVADAQGDPQRGGVTGEGPVPAELATILSGTVAANYGAQNEGPHVAPPPEDRAVFVEACGEVRTPKPVATGAACRTQDGAPVDAPALRLVGTEPFWGGTTEGRCVTYSTPEDQAGTRVWARYRARAGGGEWAGELGDAPFVLRTGPAPEGGCSDGMSDRRYRWSATIQVGGETRQGCADPAG